MSMIPKVQALLEPGESVQVAVTGQTGLNPAWRWLTYWLIVANRPRIIAVTDRRIAVFKSGNWSRQTPRQLLYSLPRSTSLSHTGHAWSKLHLGTEKIWVSRRTYSFIDAVNGGVAAGPAQPPVIAQPGPVMAQPEPVAQQPVVQQPVLQPAAVVTQTLEPQAQPQVAGAWHPDPTGRHELRYWDGAVWSPNVSDRGVVGLDPLS